MDFKGPLSSGHYILVIIDLYSRWVDCYITTSTKFTAIKKHLLRYFATYGTPKTAKTDNGAPFQGDEFKAFANEENFRHRRITPRHPRANGEVERWMRTVKKTINRCKVASLNLEEELQRVLHAYRCTPHPTTGRTPASMIGRELRIGQLDPIDDKDNIDDDDESLVGEATELPDTAEDTEEESINIQDEEGSIIQDEEVPDDPQYHATPNIDHSEDDDDRKKLEEKVAKMKAKNDRQGRSTRPHDFKVGDKVLVDLDQQHLPFTKETYTVTAIKGSMINATSDSGHKVCRNSTKFKKFRKKEESSATTADANGADTPQATPDPRPGPHTRSRGPVDQPM
jgi:hypothetical protein